MARHVCHDPANVFDVIPCDVVASVVLLSAAALHSVISGDLHPSRLIFFAAYNCMAFQGIPLDTLGGG